MLAYIIMLISIKNVNLGRSVSIQYLSTACHIDFNTRCEICDSRWFNICTDIQMCPEMFI